MGKVEELNAKITVKTTVHKERDEVQNGDTEKMGLIFLFF